MKRAVSNRERDSYRLFERKALTVMIDIFCRAQHHAKNCPECMSLLIYARKKIYECRWGDEKPVCSKCPHPCYKKDILEKIRGVMRFSGRRMIYLHPFMALRHLGRSLIGNKKNQIPHNK